MPSPAFEASLLFVLRWEGGFVDHPNDPGGPTNKGVSQKVYDAWRDRQGLAARSVRSIDHAEVRGIYEADYWLPPGCDVLRRQLDLVQFDTAVNMGVGRAVRFLQSALSCGVDGRIGPVTKRAAAECDLTATIATYCEVRDAYYRRLTNQKPDQRVFLKGWLNRLNALRATVGLGGLEAAAEVDFGDAGYIARIPDVGVDPDFDV